jgi:3-oxoadipate enol-lactonase
MTNANGGDGVGAVRLHRVVEGPEDGPVVVFGGSLGSDLRMWEPQVVPLLERGFRVVRYDTRGHGASPVPPGPYDLEDLGFDFLALLEDLDVAKAHLVGLSLGAMTGMWLGAHAPDRIASLVLCCTSAKLGPPQMWADRGRLVREKGTGAVAAAGVSRWLTPGYAERHPDRAAFLRSMIAAVPAEGYAACCGAIERMDLRDDIARIEAPTLVVSGSADGSTPREHQELIAARIPGARHETIAPGAHLSNVEQPAAFNALVLEHLR